MCGVDESENTADLGHVICIEEEKDLTASCPITRITFNPTLRNLQ